MILVTKIYRTAFFALLIALVLPATAHAEIINAPFTIDVAAMPGETITVPVTLRNASNKANKLSIEIHDFIGQKNTKEPLFTPNPSFSIKDWFRDSNLQPTITVPAGRSITYDATFFVPYDAQELTYFGGLFFINSNDDQATSVATLVHITIGNPSAAVTIKEPTISTTESFGADRFYISYNIANASQTLFTSSQQDWKIIAYDVHNNEVYSQNLEGVRLLSQSSLNYTVELSESLPPSTNRVEVAYNPQAAESVTVSTTTIPKLRPSTIDDNQDSSSEIPPTPTSSIALLIAAAIIVSLTVLAAAFSFIRRRRLHQK